jgi:proteic killer suppression protein
MIRSYADRRTQRFFENGDCPSQWKTFEKVAARKLAAVHTAARLETLRMPPGNRLEALRGDRAGQHSIRINQQWRICFRWTDDGPEDVEICDYH